MDKDALCFNSAEDFVSFLSDHDDIYKRFPEYQVLIKVWNSSQKSCGGCGNGKEKRLQILEEIYYKSIPLTPKETIESIKKHILPIVKKNIIFKSTKAPEEELLKIIYEQ
jgi:hypothetical protein